MSLLGWVKYNLTDLRRFSAGRVQCQRVLGEESGHTEREPDELYDALREPACV